VWKRLKVIFLGLGGAGILVILLALILNFPVETRQGVDYVVQTKRGQFQSPWSRLRLFLHPIL
jgi:hypothetical protein